MFYPQIGTLEMMVKVIGGVNGGGGGHAPRRELEAAE